MSTAKRLILFSITLAVLPLIYFLNTGYFIPQEQIETIIYSCLVLLSLVIYFIEPYFTKPTDVVATTISILLLISPLHSYLSTWGVFYNIFYVYNIALLISAMLSVLLFDNQQTQNSKQNTISNNLKLISTRFGNGKVIYSSLALISMLTYFDINSKLFLYLFLYLFGLIVIDPQKMKINFSLINSKSDEIGKIFGVQATNTFLVKLLRKRNPVKLFDFVELKYSMDLERGIIKGLIVDNYYLNNEQWVKVLTTREINNAFGSKNFNMSIAPDSVHKIAPEKVPDFLERFVGIVLEGSTIDKIRFQYNSKTKIQEGDLLQITISGEVVYYQIIQGITEIKLLEKKNEDGYIVGEAIQLGMWNLQNMSFEKFGWVPEINTPLLVAKNIEQQEINTNELVLGEIPNTNFPVVLNLTEIMSHHLAILGITGCGKSVLARHIIKNISIENSKIIYVDFTNESISKLSTPNPVPIISTDIKSRLFNAINDLEQEESKYPNQRNQNLISNYKDSLKTGFHDSIREFFQSACKISIFELPDVSNTTAILEYTKWFFQVLFQIARDDNNYGKKVCVVLEEAHTVVPEWNFSGSADKRSQSLVNSIGQIALQGRKYNVGFIVIAQRTANVSKTILTQCNTIIAFQQFDKTGADFLLNHMGASMVESLPRLQFRQAIAVGKAFRSKVPMIFEVPEINEPIANSNPPAPPTSPPPAPPAPA